MTYLSSKVWSDKARAAALAKRRGQAGPPQQSATAADAVAHANALIAAGALNKKPKGGGKGKGKGAAAKPKDARTPQEKTNQNRSAVAKQTGMGDLEGTVSRLSSGMHSDLEKDAHDKLISKGLAERHADGTVTLSPLGKKWKAAADKGDAAGAQGALADAQAHTADSAAKEKAKGDKAQAHAAATAERQAAREKAKADHEKAAAEKAKAKAKAAAKPKAASSGKPKQTTAEHQAAIDKTNAAAATHNAVLEKRAQAQKEQAATAEAQRVLGNIASGLATGTKPNPQQAAALIAGGMAARQKDGSIALTPRGKRAAAQATQAAATTKGTLMTVKANRRNSAADAAYHQTVHDGAVERGAVCAGMKAAARYSGSDLSHVQGMHDSSVALGAECAPVAKAAPGDMAAPPDTSTDDETLEAGEDDEEVEGGGHTGLMIALQVPPDVAAELVVDGGLAAEELHLTLAYLGDAADFQKQQFAILAAVEKVIADTQPLAATIGGVGRFITTEDDGTNAFYASVDCPELVDFRQSVIDALAELDIAPDTSHGFTPHITLAYVDASAPTPGDMPTVSDLTFGTVIVAFGDHQVLFPLGDPAADEAALEDAQDGGSDDAQEDTSGALMKSVGDDTLVNYGGAVKSLPNGHVGGYLVRFSGPNDPDLTGDFFTADTDYGFEPGETMKTAVYFNHRLPLKTRDGGQMVVKQKIGTGTLSMDETGVFIDAVLYNRERYESTLRSQGWSSGTASHLVDREPVGKSMWVKSWQLGLDASITPTPAEPRTSVVSLKSFLADTHSPQARSQAGRTPATSDAAAGADAASNLLIIVRR